MPHGRGPNLLMYNTETFTEAPTSWDAVWEGGSDYAGKISIYDSSIYIADAAVHLMATQPDLGITDPYQLNQEQFDAAIALLEAAGRKRPALLGPATPTRWPRTPPATSSSARPGRCRSSCSRATIAGPGRGRQAR